MQYLRNEQSVIGMYRRRLQTCFMLCSWLSVRCSIPWINWLTECLILGRCNSENKIIYLHRNKKNMNTRFFKPVSRNYLRLSVYIYFWIVSFIMNRLGQLPEVCLKLATSMGVFMWHIIHWSRVRNEKLSVYLLLSVWEQFKLLFVRLLFASLYAKIVKKKRYSVHRTYERMMKQPSIVKHFSELLKHGGMNIEFMISDRTIKN